ncbi:protein kinase domain-containing protein, partial [Klebsiella pneumoniae]|uniref:protein kinase domain-containing protein n=1 Tax=Klebsiella pneumoniae TaxID=573 RepID=UPI00263A4544
EYMSGGDLANYILHKRNVLSTEQTKSLLKQISDGLSFLNKFGIIHRDLKLENILVTDKSTEAVLKITDFGLSKVIGKHEKTHESVGTLLYSA